MIITKSAEIQIGLLLRDGPFKLSASGSFSQGWHVDLIANAEPLGTDVTICSKPWVIADLLAVSQLSGRTLDFNPVTDEFVISMRA